MSVRPPHSTCRTPYAVSQAWAQFARLSYPACVMKCAESWGFSLMTLAAGRLPNPGTSVAAVSVSFNLYGGCQSVLDGFACHTARGHASACMHWQPPAARPCARYPRQLEREKRGRG